MLPGYPDAMPVQGLIGEVLIMAIAWTIQSRMAQPMFAPSFKLPETQLLDAKLIGGAIMFGIGWGLAGLCPGPAIAAVVVEPLNAGAFVASMIAGIVLHHCIQSRAFGS